MFAWHSAVSIIVKPIEYNLHGIVFWIKVDTFRTLFHPDGLLEIELKIAHDLHLITLYHNKIMILGYCKDNIKRVF